MDKIKDNVTPLWLGCMIGLLIGFMVIRYYPVTIDNLIVDSISINGSNYALRFTDISGKFITKHLYTVGDTIKLCK